jgi:molybdopterin converting factor small subunit
MAKKDKIVEKWTQPEQLELLSELARDGYSNEKLAERMGCSVRSFYRYRSQYPELDRAILDGKEVVDYRVESALLKAALGYKTTEVKITLVLDNNGKLLRKVKERITRKHPPNVLACQTWLFNRQRDKWKRNRDNEIAVDDDKTINIVISRTGKTEADMEMET